MSDVYSKFIETFHITVVTLWIGKVDRPLILLAWPDEEHHSAAVTPQLCPPDLLQEPTNSNKGSGLGGLRLLSIPKFTKSIPLSAAGQKMLMVFWGNCLK